MVDWRTLTLGEALTFQRGFDITKDEQREGPYPVISSSGPKSMHAEFKVRGPGVIIGRKGSLGTVFYSDGNYWPHDTTLWIKDFHGNDPRFAYYFLQTMGFERLDAGASNPSLNRNHIHTIPVLWPPLPVQQRIAGILSTYDELIENSQRRIRILETMASALYREWFVHFRFPGHENHPCVASPLGEIPQGWEVKNLGGMTKLITKGTTPTTLGREFQQEGINFVKAESIEPSGILIERKFARIDADTHELLQRSQLCSGDILFSIAGVIGRVCSVPSRILPANTNQALAIIRCASTLHVPFLYMTMRDDNFKNHCLGHVVQTAQANVSLSVLKAVPIVCPPNALVTEFNAHTESLLRQIEVLSKKIQNLRRTRDLLLPRLLSGQINLKEN